MDYPSFLIFPVISFYSHWSTSKAWGVFHLFWVVLWCPVDICSGVRVLKFMFAWEETTLRIALRHARGDKYEVMVGLGDGASF